ILTPSLYVILSATKNPSNGQLEGRQPLRGAYPFTSFRAGSERRQMLRFAQHDTKKRAQGDMDWSVSHGSSPHCCRSLRSPPGRRRSSLLRRSSGSTEPRSERGPPISGGAAGGGGGFWAC